MLMCWGTSALDAHPDAMQGAAAEVSVRDYFVAHPQEFQELRGIAALYQALSQSGAPT
jgi:heme-binding protein